MSVRLSYREGVFYCATEYSSRGIPEKAGFLFIDDKWQTPSVHIAARLREFADSYTEKFFQRLEIKFSPWSGRFPHPNNLTPLPFQLGAARFALARNASYIAADPGTGKSIMAALMANALGEKTFERTGFLHLYICPPYLARNAEEEFTKWRASEYQISRFDRMAGFLPSTGIVIVPDNVLDRQEVFEELQYLLNECKSHGTVTFLNPDEAHRFKGEDTARTKGVLRLVPSFDRVAYMSGTPLRNARPIELFPILNASASAEIEFRNRIEFGQYYCEGFEEQTPRGPEWNFRGASNVGEFFEALKYRFMLRIPKSLLGLRGKREEIIVLEDDMPAKLIPLEKKILEYYSPEDLALGKFLDRRSDKRKEGQIPVATYLRWIGEAKVKPYWEHLKAFLDASESEAILVFAYHTSVIEALRKKIVDSGYGEPYVITGETPMPLRHELVRKFQSGKNRVFLIQREAGELGLTLTRAKVVDLLEPSWVDGQNTQCGDRADRYGQTEIVVVRYFSYLNSLDKRVISCGIDKRSITQRL